MSAKALLPAFTAAIALSTALPLAAQDVAARFVDAAGQPAGSATLRTAPGGVLIEVEVTGLPPSSWVAFHIHETMPNIWADADGVARTQVFNPYVLLTEGETQVRGRALMVHAGPDDYVTQPTGGAGDRLACGVIE